MIEYEVCALILFVRSPSLCFFLQFFFLMLLCICHMMFYRDCHRTGELSDLSWLFLAARCH